MIAEVSLQRGRSSQRFDLAALHCSVRHQQNGKCDILLHSGVKVREPQPNTETTLTLPQNFGSKIGLLL